MIKPKVNPVRIKFTWASCLTDINLPINLIIFTLASRYFLNQLAVLA